MKFHLAFVAFAICIGLSISCPSPAQEPAAESSKPEPMIQFQKHVQPLLENQCAKCHGPGDAKGGLQVNDLEQLRGYIVPGDADASSLWTDYLFTKELDLLMPPESGTKAAGLSTGDLLIMRTWINEGAQGEWSAAASVMNMAPQSNIPDSDLGKMWLFQGLFHPATTHLPIALLVVSALFLVGSFYNRDACEPVAYHCLWVGAIGAILACITGWSYAIYEGYGGEFSFDLDRRAIDRHRWLGVFLSIFSLLMIPLARNVRQTRDVNRKVMWFFASLIMMGAVGVVGFQGGELAYGEGHYGKYYKQLFNPPPAPEEGADSLDGLDPLQTEGSVPSSEVAPRVIPPANNTAPTNQGTSNSGESATKPEAGTTPDAAAKSEPAKPDPAKPD